MDLGNDNDSGGVFFLFDVGPGWLGFITLLAIIAIAAYCNAQNDDHKRDLCTEICGQYGDTSVLDGSNCLCRDEQGIYDPDHPRAKEVR